MDEKDIHSSDSDSEDLELPRPAKITKLFGITKPVGSDEFKIDHQRDIFSGEKQLSREPSA